VVVLPLVAVATLPAWRVAASAFLALAAMLAKEMAVTEPALLALLALACVPSAWRVARWRQLVLVHVLVAVGYVALRTHVVGATGQDPVTRATVIEGLRDAPWLMVHYLGITLMPFGHAAAYYVAPPHWWSWLACVALITVSLGVAWRWRPMVGAGLVGFGVALLPVLHLVPLWADLADRFVLFPSVGLALAVAAALSPFDGLRRSAGQPRGLRQSALVALLALAMMIYAGASLVEARAWRSSSLLWRYAVDRQPKAPLARANLASVLVREGRLDEAAAQFDALHALGYARADSDFESAYVYQRIGRRDDAQRAVARSLRSDPGRAGAHALKGELLLDGGDAAAAAREFVLARELAASEPAVGVLGYRLQRARGDASVDEARFDYLRALESLGMSDGAAAEVAARDCLKRAPDRVQCAAALGEALVVNAPAGAEARTLLDRCIAELPEAEAQRCQEALWLAAARD
jgi:tetratricopeptide (TPR) repeat protein